MATPREERAARRRKLAEKGAERLAFITGQLSSLPSDPPPPVSAVQPSPAVEEPPAPTTVSTSGDHEKDVSASVVPMIEQEIQPFEHNVEHFVVEDSVASSLTQTEDDEISQLQEFERDTEVVPDTANNHISEQSNIGSKTIRAAPRSSSTKLHISKFSVDEIISSIAATENIRLICASVLAIFVVISNINSSSILKGFIAWRPVYLLLLTNITMVVGFLLLSEKKAEISVDGNKYRAQDPGVDDKLRRILETGRLVHKWLHAAFLDCSAYAAVLICGSYFQQRWN